MHQKNNTNKCQDSVQTFKKFNKSVMTRFKQLKFEKNPFIQLAASVGFV